MPTEQPPPGGVPTSSGRNRFANKRMVWVVAAVAGVIALSVLYAVATAVAA